MLRPLYLALGILLLTGCASKEDTREEKGLPVVTVSVAPQAWFIDQIGGELVETRIMVPRGSNPEEYDPAPREIASLEESDLYIYTGVLPFEEVWAGHVEGSQTRTANLAEILPEKLLFPEGKHEETRGGHAHGDPHFWSSFEGGRFLAQTTYEELLELLPSDSLVLRERYLKVIEKIEGLREEALNAFGSRDEGKAFLIYHPSLTAFAQEMGLTQIAVEYEGKEPTPMHLSRIVEEAERLGAKVMLIQKEFNPENARSIAGEVHAETVEINPYDYDWEAQMRLLTEALSK